MSCRVKGLNLKILNHLPNSSRTEKGNTSPSLPQANFFCSRG
jgi:hypothetical protein